MNLRYWLWLIVFLYSTMCASRAEELVWFPLHGTGCCPDEEVPVALIVQKDSEVYMVVYKSDLVFDGSIDLPSMPITVEFPTLLLVAFFYIDEIELDDLYKIIIGFGNFPDSEYDYELGTGWIYHRKGISGDLEPRFAECFGWIYIKSYPWVYSFSNESWRYFVDAGISGHANAWYFYEEGLGWMWTTRSIYPWVYHFNQGWILDDG